MFLVSRILGRQYAKQTLVLNSALQPAFGESIMNKPISGKGKGGKGGKGKPGAGKGQGPGNAGGWPSTTGNPSGGGRSNNPSKGK